MKDQAELKEYFETLAKKPYLNQLRTKALITRSLEASEKSSLVRELVGKERGIYIEMETDLDADTVMVVKTSKFNEENLFAVDFVDVKNKTTTNTNEYFETKEEAIIAGLMTRIGGNDTVIAAVHLMIKGCKQLKK